MGIINYGLNFQSERLQAKMLENNIQTRTFSNHIFVICQTISYILCCSVTCKTVQQNVS